MSFEICIFRSSQPDRDDDRIFVPWLNTRWYAYWMF